MSIALGFREKKSPLSRLLPGRARTLELLRRLAEERGLSLERYNDNQYWVKFCPLGILSLRFEDGGLVGETQTSLAGPGFHRAVVDFIAAYAAAAGGELEVQDETSYWEVRNFKRLQLEHIGWLKAVAATLGTQRAESGSSILVNWSTDDWTPAGQEGVQTPLGRFPADYFDDDAARERRVFEIAPEFFIWYNEERDALYQRALALYALWNDCCWAPPRNEDERALLEGILANLAEARRLDPALPLPLEAWVEVAALLGQPVEPSGPALELRSAPLGYRRGDLSVPFTGGWRARLPGAMIDEDEQHGRVLWDGKRTFRLTGFEIPARMPRQAAARLRDYDPGGDPDHRVILQQGDFRYAATWYEHPAERDEHTGAETPAYRVLQGMISGPAAGAAVTITWVDPLDQPWAIRTFTGITPPKKSQ